MEATSLLAVRACPSLLSCSPAFLRRPSLSQSSHCRAAPVDGQFAGRIFASFREGESPQADDRGGPSSSTGLSVEELEEKLGKRRRSRKEKPKDGSGLDRPKPAPKDWESMSLAEKAWELYISEKGVLFWLNKLAYAAIFVIVGGWIAFRFVGPALNLYQLESPLLPPTEVFSGTK